MKITSAIVFLIGLPLLGCGGKFVQIDGYMPYAVLDVKNSPLAYLNSNHVLYAYDSRSYSEIIGKKEGMASEKRFSNYSRIFRRPTTRPASIDKIIRIVPISELFYVQFTHSALIEKNAALSGVEYSTFNSRPLPDYDFGKQMSAVFVRKGFQKNDRCPLHAYDPKLKQRLLKCRDGIYLFLHPMLVRLYNNQNRGNITHTADIIIKTAAELHPLRVIFTYQNIDKKNLIASFVYSEAYFAESVIRYLETQSI